MSLAGWRDDTLDLLVRDGGRARRYTALATLAMMVATAVLYALPFDRATDDVVSNLMFAGMVATVIAVSAVRARSAAGAHRFAWTLVAVSFAITALLFALDPESSDGDLSVALDFGIALSLAYWVAIVALVLPALPGLASLRTAADALWVTTAVVIAVWPWTLDPLLSMSGPTPAQRVLHVAFALSTIAFGTTVVVVLPHTAGRGRVALWFLGAGGAITSAAAIFHIRFHYEGTLRFGSWWDYLWTLGVGALTFGGLATPDEELRPRHRGTWWHAFTTIAPLGFAVTAIGRSDPDAGHVVGAVALLVALCLRVLALLAENERLTRSLHAAAHNDPLTGLGNRRALESEIARIGDTARAERRLRAVVVIDLDRFKEINDTHGHLVGDDVLRLVARRLREAVREADLLVRHGGDEFVAAMTVRDEQEAIQAGERLRAAVRGTYALDVGDLHLDATMGISIDTGDGRLADVLTTADEALYSAKTTARGTVRLKAWGTGSPERVDHLPHQ